MTEIKIISGIFGAGSAVAVSYSAASGNLQSRDVTVDTRDGQQAATTNNAIWSLKWGSMYKSPFTIWSLRA